MTACASHLARSGPFLVALVYPVAWRGWLRRLRVKRGPLQPLVLSDIAEIAVKSLRQVRDVADWRVVDLSMLEPLDRPFGDAAESAELPLGEADLLAPDGEFRSRPAPSDTRHGRALAAGHHA
jgi:hypothetical protein